MSNQIQASIYQAAAEAAIFVDRSNLGLLKIRGETRLDLIDRMSTQKLTHLQSGAGAATVLTTGLGRIVDRLIVYASSDTLYALTGENNSDNLVRYLTGYVFFDDDFHLEDVSADTAILGVYGPQAGDALAQAGFPGVDLPLHHWRQEEVEGLTAYLHRTDPLAGDGYFVMCRETDRDALWTRLQDAGLTVADEAAFDTVRIERGLPRFGYEITGQYNPLETGLWDDVSFSKGCYVGQEIIARMESRGKLAKQLVQLRPERPVEPRAEITANGRSVGSITSAAVLPDGPVALGYVKTRTLKEGAELTVGEAAVSLTNGASLPVSR